MLLSNNSLFDKKKIYIIPNKNIIGNKKKFLCPMTVIIIETCVLPLDRFKSV